MRHGCELRFYDVADLEVREAGGKRTLSGHAAVFDKPSVKFPGGWREYVRAGAFAESIAQDDVRALWNHNSDVVLGRKKPGTLRLKEDKQGLAVEIDLPDTQAGKDAEVSVKRGDVSQMSFAFRVPSGGDRWFEEEEEERRELLKVQLFEVSPVTFPAYPDTDVAAKGMRAAGIDMEALGRIVLRAEAGRELRADDSAVLEAAIGVLTKFLKPANARAISREAKFALLRRQLALEEAL